MRKRTGQIWQIATNDLQDLLDRSESMVEVLRHIGVDPYSGNHKTLHQRIREDGLRLDLLEQNRRAARRKQLLRLNSEKLSDSEVFVEGSTYDRKHIKRRIIERELLPLICAECGVGTEYNGKPLVLQLDHINGKNRDHRLENLRFLCPNCHSQTTTFASKNKEHRKRIDIQNRKFDPSKEELAELVAKMPMTQVGKHFGVSDNAVRKRCRLLGIEW